MILIRIFRTCHNTKNVECVKRGLVNLMQHKNMMPYFAGISIMMRKKVVLYLLVA